MRFTTDPRRPLSLEEASKTDVDPDELMAETVEAGTRVLRIMCLFGYH